MTNFLARVWVSFVPKYKLFFSDAPNVYNGGSLTLLKVFLRLLFLTVDDRFLIDDRDLSRYKICQIKSIISRLLMQYRSFVIIMLWSKLLKAGAVSLGLTVLAEIGYGIFGFSEISLASLAWLCVIGIILFLMLSFQLKQEVV
ncbi:hypothetical protein OAI35_01140 [Paracoccaceae bacterium]|nr:hypothetical protein [Paracoccaceae bacterium]